MSRSIHETRRMIRDARREDWCNHEERENRLAELKAKLERKKKVKAQIEEERQGQRTLAAGEEIIITIDPAAIPIIVKDEGPFVHYPATPDDLRAVMRRLPQGVCDGLAGIELCLGKHEAPSEWVITLEHKPDPYTGRISGQMMTDVWAKDPLGCYDDNASTIRMHAFVFPPALQDPRLKNFLLKLQALSTFVHEVAHHHDFTRRTARGRWLPEEGTACENYADELQHDWLHQIVVPYLEETYPEESRYFIKWVKFYGGVQLTLDQIAGDPRKCIFNIFDTFFSLIEDVEKGNGDIDTRYDFADELQMSGFYAEALSVIENILAENKANPEEDRENIIGLQRLKAHIFIDQGIIILDDKEQHAEGRALLEQGRELALTIIEMKPDYTDAWRELWCACEWLELWEEVIAATTREFELEGADPKAHYVSTIQPRIRARLALGDFAGADADIQILEQSPFKSIQRKAGNYRLKLMQAKAARQA